MTDRTPDIDLAQDHIFSIATSPAFRDDGICFAARSTGLYRSSDAGATWLLTGTDIGQSLVATAVCISPGFTADRGVIAGVPGGALVSHDAGTSWRSHTLGIPAPVIAGLTWAKDNSIFMMTMEDGIFRSSDGGDTWKAANAGLPDYGILALALSPVYLTDGTAFIGTASGVFMSHTFGRSWHETPSPIDHAAIAHLATFASPSGEVKVIAGTETGVLLLSSDRGCSWDQITPGDNSDIVALSWAPGDGEGTIVIVRDLDLVASTDAGRTWHRQSPSTTLPAPIVAAAPLTWSDPLAGFLVGLADGSIAVIG